MVMRINGFSSGMDIDSTVKQLMQVARMPLDKLNQKKQTLLWQQEDYRTINNKILDLKNQAFNMKLQSPYLSKKASSGNDNIISASATPGATDGIYKLKVEQMAESASLTSSAPVGATAGSASTIDSIRTSVPGSATKLTITGEKGTTTIEVNDADTINAFVSNFNSKSNITGVKVSYESNMDRFFFVSTNTGAAAKVELNTDDADFLTDVLQVATAPLALSESGQFATGEIFKTTPPPAPDLNKVIDSTIVGTQTLRVNYKGADYNFNITSSTKIGDLINSMNASGLKTVGGVNAGLESTTGKLTLTLSGNSGEIINFSDASADGTNIVSILGLPVSSATSTVQGAEFTSPVPAYVDNNKLINESLTKTQKIKIDYGTKSAEFEITNKTTIGSLMTAINTSDIGKAGVTVQLDATTGALTFREPDSTVDLAFTDVTPVADRSNILSTLKLDASITRSSDFSYAQVVKNGQDAKIWFNDVSAFYSSNSVSINGINFTAKKEDLSDVYVTISQDIDTVYNNIKSFVDKYNEVLDVVNKKTSEERYRDYTPLTEDQKKEMEENEIKLWEEKAKSGLLRNDSMLSNVASRFRTSWYDSVSGISSGDYKQLAEIGITTLVHTEKGKLYIDETKLKEAITSNPEQVMRLFTNNDNDSNSTSGDGVALRIYEAADQVLSQLKTKAGNSLMVNANFEIGKEVNRLNTRIDDMNRKLQALETRYYNQFTAMEQAMNKYNSQASYLGQMASQ